MNKLFDRPAAAPFIAMMFGIVSGVWLPGYKNIAFVIGILLFCLIIYRFLGRIFGFSFIRQKESFPFLSKFLDSKLFCSFAHNTGKKQNGQLCKNIIFGLLGYILIQSAASPNLPTSHIVHYADSKEKYYITGVVSSEPIYKNGIVRFETIVDSIKNGEGVTVPVIGKINIAWMMRGSGYENLFEGDRVEFLSKIKRIRNFHNPGGFDYERYMAFKKIYVSASIYGDNLKMIKNASAFGFTYFINKMRANISDLMDMLHIERSERESEVLKALIIGKQSGIPQEVKDDFNNTGVTHVLAISGLNIGIVASVVFFLFSKFFSFFPIILRHAWVKKLASFFAIFAAITYGFLTGMSPSAQRAVVMVSVFFSSFIFEREHDTLNSLAVAGIIILFIEPSFLFSISFILSFAAVFSIYYGMRKIYRKGKGKPTLLRKIYIFFLVSICAIIGTIPIILYYFNTLSIFGLLANVIAVPVIGFFVTILGLISVSIYPLSLTLSLFILKIAAFMLSVSINLIGMIADIPFSHFKVVTPSILEIFCFYSLIFILLNWKTSRNIRIIAAFTTIILCLDIAYWSYQRFFYKNLRITILDVGQGSAALIELPEGECMMIDGGGFSDNSSFDVGESVVAPFLWRKKIRSIETIALTHPNSDHVNGLTYIAHNFFVKNLWSNNEPEDSRGYKTFIKAVEDNGVKNISFKELFGVRQINGVKFEVIYPPKDFESIKNFEEWRDLNNNSMVIRVQFGNFSFLFVGDIEKRAEKELVELLGDKLKSSVLLAPHHGSKTSSSDIFLDAAAPKVVIISAGFQNRYGFPHPTVINRYKERGCKIFQTNIDGAVTIKSDGNAFEVSAYTEQHKF